LPKLQIAPKRNNGPLGIKKFKKKSWLVDVSNMFVVLETHLFVKFLYMCSSKVSEPVVGKIILVALKFGVCKL